MTKVPLGLTEGTEAERDASVWLIAALVVGSVERTIAIRTKGVLPQLVRPSSDEVLSFLLLLLL